MGQRREAMTVDELLAIRTTTVDIETGNRALGFGRSMGFRLAREGRYPCRVISAGNARRVVTADLRRVLGVGEPTEQTA